MKKFQVFFLFTLLSGAVLAQERGFRIGPKVMIGTANFTSYNTQGSIDSKLLLGGGLHGGYQFVKMFAIEAELMYVSKGSKVSGTENSGIIISNPERYNTDYRLGYIEIPVMGKISLPLGNFYLKAYGGPSFNYNVYSKYTTEFEKKNTQNGDMKNINVMELALVLGAGFDIDAGDGGLYSIDVRLSQANDSGQDNNNVNFSNRYVGLSLGVSF